MDGISFGLVISFLILIFGIGAFNFLVKRYREQLLNNFNQKIVMTSGLGIIFGSLFMIALLLIAKIKEHLSLQDPWLLIRMSLGLIIVNACLILACRSLIKGLNNFLR